MESQPKRRITLEQLREAQTAEARKGTDYREELIKLGYKPEEVDEFLAQRYGDHRPERNSESSER